jgi:hypothetical protein
MGDFINNLKNKIVYKAHMAVYDPSANQYAKDISEQTAQVSANDNTKQSDVQPTVDTTDSESDPNFSYKRVIKKTASTTLKYTLIGLYILAIGLIGTLVANEMIILPSAFRLVGFIFIVSLCTFLPPALFGMIGLYILRFLYILAHNTILRKESEPAKQYWPYIYAILPLTTNIYETTFAKIFMYPFTYPKSPDAISSLEQQMKTYETTLQSAVLGFKNYASGPGVAENISKVHAELTSLHAINQKSSNT